jgi:hypothetical protein
MTHYNKKQQGITLLHGEGISGNVYSGNGSSKNPIAKSIKTRQDWQNALQKLALTSAKYEQLNLLFEEMAMASYDMGVKSNEK